MKKQKVVDFLKHNKTGMMLSFALPILIMFITYYTLGIYPGSERSILASDSFSQYAAFHASFKNAMQESKAFLQLVKLNGAKLLGSVSVLLKWFIHTISYPL
ncbi:YfhO family protein [Enterococcus termitis]